MGLAGIAIWIAALAAGEPQAQGVPSPPVEWPPRVLWAAERRPVPLLWERVGLEGQISCDAPQQTVSFRWHRVRGERPPDWRLSLQGERVDFWPTDVGRLDEGVVVVAGKTREGRTVIEVWQLDPPAVASPAAPGERSSAGPLVPIARKGAIYDARVPGRDLVRALWRNRGKARSFFAQFHDSGDVYEVALRDDGERVALASMKRVASPLGGGSWVVEPALATKFPDRWDADHVRGFVYFAADSHTWQASEGTPGGVVLIDADRDGALDASLSMTGEEWGTLGFARGDAYRPDR